MYFLLEMVKFHCHVSLLEGRIIITVRNLEVSTIIFTYIIIIHKRKSIGFLLLSYDKIHFQ